MIEDVPCDRNFYITVITFPGINSALHYILFTANIFGWNNFALHYITLTATLKLHTFCLDDITSKIPEGNYFCNTIHYGYNQNCFQILKCNNFRSSGTPESLKACHWILQVVLGLLRWPDSFSHEIPCLARNVQPMSGLSGPLNRLNALLPLLHPLDQYKTPSAIGSAIGRPYVALSRIHTQVGVLNRLVLSRLEGSTARFSCKLPRLVRNAESLPQDPAILKILRS